MWSSGLDNHNNINSSSSNSGHGGSSGRIVSSSSSSRSSPSSNSSILRQNPKTRTMEEVWKDISLTTLHQERAPLAPLPESQSHPHHHHHPHPHHLHPAHPTASPSFRTMTLQDFLSGPCSTVSPAAAAVEGIPLPPPRPPLPATALSLNSGFELQYQGGGGGRGGGGGGGAGGGGGGGGGGGSALMNGHSRSSSNSNGSRVNDQANNSSNNYGHISSFIPPSFSDVVIRPPSPAGLFSSSSKKRMIPEDPGIGGDRRHKRMIKNRESAARSRARKQAHLLYPLYSLLLLLSLSLSLSALFYI